MSETLNVVQAPIAPKINPLRIVSAALFLIIAIAACFNSSIPVIPEMLSNVSFYPDSAVLTVQYAFSIVAVPVGCFALAIIGFVSRKSNLLLWASVALYFLVAPLSWILQAIFIGLQKWDTIYWSLGSDDRDFLGWALLVAFTLAVVLVVLSKLLVPQTVKQDALPRDEETVVPISAAGAPSNLPVFALVGSFVFSLAGVILGHIAISQMKRGQISSANRNLAVAGLVIGYIFTIISLISIIFVLAVLYQFGYFTAHYY